MTSSSIDFKNLSINHACRAIFEISKHLPNKNQNHEINEFMKKINPCCDVMFDYNVIYSMGLKMTAGSGNINGLIICLYKHKIEIDLYDCDYASLYGTFINYLSVNEVPNSSYKCLHIISDAGVFMYRGEIKVHPIK